jgi:hypothetical protein
MGVPGDVERFAEEELGVRSRLLVVCHPELVEGLMNICTNAELM